ncbi:uncharacterized protein LOC120244707 [Hyaena hyaena]|uniref:uncharacterized protein LOC120244707 n=1 Tax=Hyaena hyaena TaxID=95912 RepID=UPI0019221871|nr:uncharacterized protein LOC120244707 [Hyaena hyaena]
MIMKKRENESLSSSLKETKEAWGAAEAENPSLNTCDVSLTSVYSLTDDAGYQGSQELTGEEDPGRARCPRRKRGKVAAVRLRRDAVTGEGEDEEDADAENAGPPRAAPSPRVWRKRRSSSRTRAPRQEPPRALGSRLSTFAAETKSSGRSLARFRHYLCGCCDLRRRRGADPEAEAAGGAGGQAEPPGAASGSCPADEHRTQGAAGGAPGDQEDGQDHPAPV